MEHEEIIEIRLLEFTHPSTNERYPFRASKIRYYDNGKNRTRYKIEDFAGVDTIRRSDDGSWIQLTGYASKEVIDEIGRVLEGEFSISNF